MRKFAPSLVQRSLTRSGIARWLLGQELEHTGLMLGNDASGKTTMLYQLKLGEEIVAIPTIGFNVETVEYPKGRKATLWDVGGKFSCVNHLITLLFPKAHISLLDGMK